MARASLVLITAIALGSFFTQQAQGQFPIRIPVPKIPKKDAPATPQSSDVASASADADSSKSDDAVRGQPIPGAKITFSNNPDGSNPKTSFASSEFIYGKLDLGGKTVYDAFGLKGFGNAKFYHINYDVQIWKPGEKPWENWTSRRATLITKEDAQKTYWNFDVLPDPTKVTTLGSAIEDDLSYYKFVTGIYGKFYDQDSARSVFPQSGTYTIDITLFGMSFDDWGKATFESEKYPTASAAFAFKFSGTDGQTLVANQKAAVESILTAKSRREMYRSMPDWWSKSSNPPEPKLAPARLVPMIKGFIGQWNLVYMKHMITEYTGPLWVIQKNSIGIPEYRMVKPYIYIIYKDPKDNACNVGALYMRESYSGAGTYGSPFLGGIRDVQMIDCAVIK